MTDGKRTKKRFRNKNRIQTSGFSSLASESLYRSGWPSETQLQQQYSQGRQCGSCSFYAQFNKDWGLCCHRRSRHWQETVFEHFTCPSLVHEGWGPHSFTIDRGFHCSCEPPGSSG